MSVQKGDGSVLDNKLGITNSAELAKEEERISKKKAVEMFNSGFLDTLKPGSVEALLKIHEHCPFPSRNGCATFISTYFSIISS